MPRPAGARRQPRRKAACGAIRAGTVFDAQGVGPGVAALPTLADTLEEVKTICACGSKASMNMRIDAAGSRVTEGEQVLIGGNDRYRAVCPDCFYAETDDPARAPGLFG